MSKKIIAVLIVIIAVLVGVIVGITIGGNDKPNTPDIDNQTTEKQSVPTDECVLVSEKHTGESGELRETTYYNYDIDGHITSSVATFADGETQTTSNYVYYIIILLQSTYLKVSPLVASTT